MKPSIIAAGLAACALAVAAPASAQVLLTPNGHITLRPGQSIQQAITQAAFIDNVTHAGRTGAATGSGSTRADGAPTINSGAMLSNTLTVGSAGSVPAMQFNCSTGPAGFGGAGFTFTSPNGQTTINLPFYSGAFSRKASIVFAGHFGAPNFAQPGRWTLSSAFIGDQAYNFTNYNAAQLSALIENPVIDVVNTGPVDITPPAITSGTVLTPTVSLSDPSPQFQVKLGGTDNLSGVAFGFVLIKAPGSPFQQTQMATAPVAFTNGSMIASGPIFSGNKAGTWHITGAILCDVAGNCTSNTHTPAEVKALFGTNTFTVTN